MVSEFESHLAEYSNYSNVIERIAEDDFSHFNPGKGDEILFWDKKRHVGVMNRHNYALLFWIDYFLSSGKKPVLIHVDRHADMAEPRAPDHKKMKNPEYAANYIDNIKVKEFIKPALDLGLFESVELRGHDPSNSFEDFDKLLKIAKNNPVVFDLDLDVYAKNPLIGEEYSNERHREVGFNHKDSYINFAEMMHLADLTTIAFSPDYIESSSEIMNHLKGIRSAYSELEDEGGSILGSIRGLF